MLAGAGPETFWQLIEATPLLVRLPEEMETFFEEKGYVATTPFDERAAPRLRFRCRALLEVLEPLPSYPRETGLATVLISDLSRSGIGLLHHEQLWPEERIRVLLPDCQLEAIVARARKRGVNCYDIGARLIGRSD
jgi:hypothetical protein